MSQECNGLTRVDVKFSSNGIGIAGHLYLPEGMPAPGHAIVVGHPGTGVKEQAAGLYARRLAAKGFATLAFDAAFQGESEGEPRGLEDPAQRVEDMKSAVSFLSAHSAVNPDRIGLLGICASGGYAIAAAATDVRVKAVATVSGVDTGRQFRSGADGTQSPAVFRALLEAAAAARSAEAAGGDVGYFPVFPASATDARKAGRHVYEGWEYYCSPRAEHSRSAKAFTWSSVDRIAGFDAFRFIDGIAPRAIMMIVGRRAITSWMTSEAFAAAREPKQVHWIEGASHVDLYDREEYVDEAVHKLVDFFTELLRST